MFPPLWILGLLYWIITGRSLWDDWEEYNTDREGLVMKAMKLYLRRYFPDWYEKASKMFA
jgi:hypothetical protein